MTVEHITCLSHVFLLCCSIVYNLSLCLSYCLVWRINVFIAVFHSGAYKLNSSAGLGYIMSFFCFKIRVYIGKQCVSVDALLPSVGLLAYQLQGA